MERLTQITLNSMRLLSNSQRVIASNLANQNTIGFRKDVPTNLGSVYLQGDSGIDDRVFATQGKDALDDSSGTMIPTDRALDVAVNGPGYIVGQTSSGEQVLTRRGDMTTNAQGQMLNGEGLVISGDQGPLTIPPYSSIDISQDGTVSIQPLGATPGQPAQVVGRIKLVEAQASDLKKGLDGLIRPTSGTIPQSSANVQLGVHFLESSNVNSVDSMVDMIETSRSYEMKVKLLSVAKDLDTASAKLMNINN
jgi:flagellar basal-body rod protein FlgF